MVRERGLEPENRVSQAFVKTASRPHKHWEYRLGLGQLLGGFLAHVPAQLLCVHFENLNFSPGPSRSCFGEVTLEHRAE